MSETQPQFPLAAEGTQTPFFCALHGTVSQCPFKFMNCDYDPDLDRLTIVGKYPGYMPPQSIAGELE